MVGQPNYSKISKTVTLTIYIQKLGLNKTKKNSARANAFSGLAPTNNTKLEMMYWTPINTSWAVQMPDSCWTSCAT
jgi:hypothetical protein